MTGWLSALLVENEPVCRAAESAGEYRHEAI